MRYKIEETEETKETIYIVFLYKLYIIYLLSFHFFCNFVSSVSSRLSNPIITSETEETILLVLWNRVFPPFSVAAQLAPLLIFATQGPEGIRYSPLIAHLNFCLFSLRPSCRSLFDLFIDFPLPWLVFVLPTISCCNQVVCWEKVSGERSKVCMPRNGTFDLTLD